MTLINQTLTFTHRGIEYHLDGEEHIQSFLCDMGTVLDKTYFIKDDYGCPLVTRLNTFCEGIVSDGLYKKLQGLL